jgi:uncharacterized protein YbbC (DUF1343 family)
MGDETDRRETRFELTFLLNSNELLNGKTFIDRSDMFNLLAGNDVLAEQLKNGTSEQDIRASWQEKLEAFKLVREKYLVYE